MSAAENKEKFPCKLWNSGQREIHFHRGEGDATQKLSLKPKSSARFTKQEAEKLLKLYKNELIDMDNVSEANLLQPDIQGKLIADGAQQERDIAMRLEAARADKKQKAYEEALREGFTDAEARGIAGLDPVEEAEKDDLGSKDDDEFKV